MPLRYISDAQHVIVNSAAGGTLPIVSAAPNLRTGLYRMILTVAAAVTVTLQDTSGAALSQPFTFGTAGGSVTIDVPINGDPWWSAPLGRGLQFNASAAVQVSADVWYLQTP